MKLKWKIILGLSLICLLASILGWQITFDEAGKPVTASTLFDAVWGTMKGSNYYVLSSAPLPTHWLTFAAKMLAKLIIILTALTGLEQLFHEQVRGWLFRIRRAGKHTVILGLGERGSGLVHLALRFLPANKVVIIEKDSANLDLGSMRDRGMLVIVGNALDPKVLRKACPAKAAEIYAVTGSDETNLSLINTLAQALPNPDVFLVGAVESDGYKGFFRDRLLASLGQKHAAARPIITSFASKAALEILYKHGLASLPAASNGFRVFIQAHDTLRWHFVRAAGQLLHPSPRERLSILCADTPAKEGEEFSRHNACLDLVCHFKTSEQKGREALTDTKSPAPHLAVFACSNDSETLGWAERFSIGHPDSRVIACLRDSGSLGQLAKTLQNTETPGPGLFVEQLYNFSERESVLGWAAPDIERAARDTHEAYLRNVMEGKTEEEIRNLKSGSVAMRSWSELPEHLRESNRLAAAHHQFKRAVWKLKGAHGSQAQIEELAEAEHLRWMSEKIFDGWRCGPRNNATRHHPSLLPYAALSEAEKEKDRVVVREALGLPAV